MRDGRRQDPRLRGADASIHDARYQSTALGWATHHCRDDVIVLLGDPSI